MGSISVQSVQSGQGSRGERLSAFVDGELDGGEYQNDIFADLDRDGRAAWSSYHLIGDVLRSDDLALSPVASHAFMAGFAARFDAEPHLLAPAAIPSARSVTSRLLGLRRRVVPTLAVAAAAATLTWIVLPQMHGAGVGPSRVQVASASRGDGVQQVAMTSASAQDGNIIRDARLDEYLQAHQQFAQQPVMSDSMPLIRAATFTTRGQ